MRSDPALSIQHVLPPAAVFFMWRMQADAGAPPYIVRQCLAQEGADVLAEQLILRIELEIHRLSRFVLELSVYQLLGLANHAPVTVHGPRGESRRLRRPNGR